MSASHKSHYSLNVANTHWHSLAAKCRGIGNCGGANARHASTERLTLKSAAPTTPRNVSGAGAAPRRLHAYLRQHALSPGTLLCLYNEAAASPRRRLSRMLKSPQRHTRAPVLLPSRTTGGADIDEAVARGMLATHADWWLDAPPRASDSEGAKRRSPARCGAVSHTTPACDPTTGRADSAREACKQHIQQHQSSALRLQIATGEVLRGNIDGRASIGYACSGRQHYNVAATP
jgi:hypothetical protein